MAIHPTAVVEDGVSLGAGVSVGPHAFIESGAQVGNGCSVGPNAVIYRYTTIGDGTRVHAGAVLGDDPQDLAFQGGDSYVRIGRDCILREGVTVHRGTKTDTATVIGDGCHLMALSHLGHNVVLGRNVILANNVLLGGYVEVGDGVFMGGGAGVHQFVHIGRLVMVGGNGGISKDVPPFCMTHSVAYNHIAGLNVLGMRRAGLSGEERKQVRSAFKLLYTSGLNVSQAADRIRQELPEGPAQEFCRFIEASTRGLCRYRGGKAE